MIALILSGISITGALLNANGKRIGFWVWMIANCGWIIHCLKIKLYGQIPMWIVYSAICVMGLIRWKQKGIK